MSKTYKLIFNPQVYLDIQNQVDYYFDETKSHSLGKRFVNAVKLELLKLEQNALHYEIKYDDIRCLPIPKIPCRAHFRVIENIVWVEVIIGTKENPKKWGDLTKK
ncbi:MAG: hypothetical protein ACPGVC_10460 [Salibacteraceae bacterium]